MEEVPSHETEAIRKKEIEQSQEERLDLFKKIAKKWAENKQLQRAAMAVFNASIGSYLTLSLEALRGKTTVGNQELTPLGRIMNIVIVTTGLITYPTVFSEQLRPVAGGLYTASWLAWLAMYGPDLAIPVLQKAMEKNEETNPKLRAGIDVTLKWIEKSKGLWFKKDKNNEQ